MGSDHDQSNKAALYEVKRRDSYSRIAISFGLTGIQLLAPDTDLSVLKNMSKLELFQKFARAAHRNYKLRSLLLQREKVQ